MPNPWLGVPLTEYEAHMAAAEVQQLRPLAELFAEALAVCRPASVAVLGVAGGNGLERIDGRITSRVVGVDINPSYLDEARRRHADVRGLELHCVDLAEARVEMEPVELVHAALVFEHAGAGPCLANALALVAPGGSLSVVLQLPGEGDAVNSRFAAVQGLAAHFALIEPAWLRAEVEQQGFRLAYESRRALPAGKAFWMGIFRRE
jgi:SAM-dependent methyltransferase